MSVCFILDTGSAAILFQFPLSDKPSYYCIYDIIKQLGYGGISLYELVIDLDILGKHRSLAPRIELTFDSNVLQNLRIFAFTCIENLRKDEVDNLHEFLAACLDTVTLRKIHLDIRVQEGRAKTNMARILGQKFKPRLEYIDLNPGIDMEFAKRTDTTPGRYRRDTRIDL